MTKTTDLDLFIKAINFGVKKAAEEICEEEIARAKKRIEDRLRQEIDKIALNLCSEYSVERMGTDIRITIRKQL